MLVTIIIFAVGIAALVKGADLFVGSAAGIARAFNVPGLIIGLTIVALGTSAPELAVSVTAALQGSNEIAISNVIGSNMLNLMGVLGLCALIKPIPVETDILKRDFPFSIAITVLLLCITCSSLFFRGRLTQISAGREVGTASHLDGLLLMLVLAVYIAALIYSAKRNAPEGSSEDSGQDTEAPADKKGIWRSVLVLILGIAMIIGGGEAVVYSAKEIARALGMSETLIGLTVVAIGTSLPELVTSVMAALKGEVNMAIGNIIGSNVFNILFILGVSAAINPIGITAANALDILILICINILMFLFALSSKRISRLEGGIMLVLYAADIVFAFLR